MNISSKLDLFHARIKQNLWMRLFTVFNRIALAAGFLPSGFVKITGERFTDLPCFHPMGRYLTAFYNTGYYYTFVGIMQMTAAILLLIPRTATLGVLIYFPIILNIFILTLSVRFVGSLLTSPLMVLACLYLLCWDYDKLKYILPWQRPPAPVVQPVRQSFWKSFPFKFAAGAAAAIFLVGVAAFNAFNIQPFNDMEDCKRQCIDSPKSSACNEFCECIHTEGRVLKKCLDAYNEAPADAARTPVSSGLPVPK